MFVVFGLFICRCVISMSLQPVGNLSALFNPLFSRCMLFIVHHSEAVLSCSVLSMNMHQLQKKLIFYHNATVFRLSTSTAGFVANS